MKSRTKIAHNIRYSLLIFVFSLLGACLGDESIPVVYISPEEDQVYTVDDLVPEVEFPNGLPTQASVEIRINGVDVSSEFDDWDTVANRAKISAPLTSGAYPAILSALREGENTFQVTAPEMKKVVYFTMNLAGADIHITHVLDNYCGTVFISEVGNNFDLGDGAIRDFDCTRYYFETCEHPDNLDTSRGCRGGFGTEPTWGYNCLGEPIYQSILASECDDLRNETSTTESYSSSNNTSPGSFDHYTYVRGYFESESALDNIYVSVFELSAGSRSFYTFPDSSPGEGKTVEQGGSWESSPMYVHFGVSDVSCNGVDTDLQVNEFCMLVPDLDNIEIGGTDTEGFAKSEWMKSHIGMKESTLGNGGVVGVRVDETAVYAFMELIGDTLSDQGDIIELTGSGDAWLIDPAEPDGPPEFCIGCKFMGISFDSIELNSFSLHSPELSSAGSNVGRFEMFLDLNAPGSDYGLDVDGDISIGCLSFDEAVGDCFDVCNDDRDSCTSSASRDRSRCIDRVNRDNCGCSSGIFGLPCRIACSAGKPARRLICEGIYLAEIGVCTVEWGACGAICTGVGTGSVIACEAIISRIEGPYSLGVDAYAGVRADLTVDNDYKVRATTTMQNPDFTIRNIDLDIDDELVSLLLALVQPLIAPVLEIAISALGILEDTVTNIVNGLFNNDLPRLRLSIPSIDTEGEATKFRMALGPEIAGFRVAPNLYSAGGSPLQTLEVELGLHATGKPRLNHSLGNIYESGVGHSLLQVTTARDDDPANASTMGLMVHEAFVNQLFMGFWESGILYIDFNTGDDPLLNTFMNNADIKFASASPWSIDILGPGENSPGDLKINIDDLIISFAGDIYDPFQGRWYYDRVFFNLTVELEAYVNVLASNEAVAFQLSSKPSLDLVDFYSDYIAIDLSLGQSLLNIATNELVLNTGLTEIPLPAINGLNLNMQDIWMPDSKHMAITVDAEYTAP